MGWNERLRKDPTFRSREAVRDAGLLYPPFREKISRLLEDCRKAGLNVALFETYRSAERQAKLWAEGRTKLRANGMHYYGVAADIVFLDEKGEFTWNVKKELWERLGALGRKRGLNWGGDWKGFRDCPHFQLVPATRAAQGRIARGVYP